MKNNPLIKLITIDSFILKMRLTLLQQLFATTDCQVFETGDIST